MSRAVVCSYDQGVADYQFIVDPAYNTDRGPVSVIGGRFHWQF